MCCIYCWRRASGQLIRDSREADFATLCVTRSGEGEPLIAIVTFADPAGSTSIAAAVGSFLDAIPVATTRASYAETLARLAEHIGPSHPVAELTPKDYATVMAGWSAAAPATWNRHLSVLTSFTDW